MIFTDGAVCGGSVGFGACAAVLIPLTEAEEIHVATCAVGIRVSSLDCEVEGIALGIKVATQYLGHCSSKTSVGKIYIFCDCASAIESVYDMKFGTRPGVFRKFQDIRNQLHDCSMRVNLVKITGHSGIFGNDMADTHAKDIANKIAKGEISAPNSVSVTDCYKIAADIVLKSWQRSWSNENTGRFTYDLIPQVGTKVTFPRNRSVGVAYTRMLLRDTMLKDDSFRTGTSDTPICDCGMANETMEHFLLR